MLSTYKNDRSTPNPFKEPDSSMSTRLVFAAPRANQPVDGLLDRLKHKFAQEESEQRRSGVPFSHKVTPAQFLQLALKVEEAQ